MPDIATLLTRCRRAAAGRRKVRAAPLTRARAKAWFRRSQPASYRIEGDDGRYTFFCHGPRHFFAVGYGLFLFVNVDHPEYGPAIRGGLR